MKIFRTATRIIDLPEVCGRRLSVGEVKLALANNAMVPAVRAMVQLLVMTRQEYLTASQEKARGGVAPLFELGAAQGIEDMLAELLKLVDGQVSDDVRRFFADE